MTQITTFQGYEMSTSLRLFVVIVFAITFSIDALAQRFTVYKDSTLCVRSGFSDVIRSADGPEFYAYSQYDLSARLVINRFRRTKDSLECYPISSEGATLPTTSCQHAQVLLVNDTMYLGRRQVAYRSVAWGTWESTVVESGDREMVLTSLNALPDGRILVAAQSYLVTRRDTSGGTEVTWIDSSKAHVGYLDGTSFSELTPNTDIGNSAMHMPGAIMPDGTTYLSKYRGSAAQTLMFEVKMDGNVNAIPPPAGLPGGYQSPVIVRVGENVVYLFYGASRLEGVSNPACYVRYDRRTQESTRHIIDSPYPSGGWSGDTLALVVGSGTVHVLRENSVSTYRIMDQITDLPWVPGFYSVHRTSSTEWLIGSNSGIFFFEFDATTSVDDNTAPQHSDRFATTSRSIDLTNHASTSDAPTWTVLDALGRICTEGTGTTVSLPTPPGLYIVKFDTGLITVLAM